MAKEPGEPRQENELESLSVEELERRIKSLGIETDSRVDFEQDRDDTNASMDLEYDPEHEKQRGAQISETQAEQLKERGKYLEAYKKRTGKDYVYPKPESEK